MVKKVVLLILALGLLAGGFFYWWNSQADVRELNKTLPKGVMVVKSLYGNEYKVVNRIDGYEFKVPQEWGGIEEIEYMPEATDSGYTASSLGIQGNSGSATIFGVDKYENTSNLDLKQWAETNFKTFGLIGDFSEDKVGEFNIVKTKENVHLAGMFVYFFKKNNAIYAIVNGSEGFIKYIITNGKW